MNILGSLLLVIAVLPAIIDMAVGFSPAPESGRRRTWLLPLSLLLGLGGVTLILIEAKLLFA